MPRRIQMTRSSPWRCDNPDAVIVDRRSEWGNRHRIGDPDPATGSPMGASAVVFWFEADLDPLVSSDATAARERIRNALRGRDLACWCALDAPCHADVLLKIANE